MMQLQLVCLLFALAMLYWTYLAWRRRTLNAFELAGWFAVWTGFGVVVLFPASTRVLLERLHINRTMDLVSMLGFMLMWVVVFRNYVDLRQQRRRLQDLVRELALRDAPPS
jgi:hypothetical protein